MDVVVVEDGSQLIDGKLSFLTRLKQSAIIVQDFQKWLVVLIFSQFKYEVV